MLEYVLVIAFIAIAVVGAVSAFGGGVDHLFNLIVQAVRTLLQ